MQAQVNLLLTKITSADKFNIQEVNLMDRFASLCKFHFERVATLLRHAEKEMRTKIQ